MRLRFRVWTLCVLVALVAVGIGSWFAYRRSQAYASIAIAFLEQEQVWLRSAAWNKNVAKGFEADLARLRAGGEDAVDSYQPHPGLTPEANERIRKQMIASREGLLEEDLEKFLDFVARDHRAAAHQAKYRRMYERAASRPWILIRPHTAEDLTPPDFK